MYLSPGQLPGASAEADARICAHHPPSEAEVSQACWPPVLSSGDWRECDLWLEEDLLQHWCGTADGVTVLADRDAQDMVCHLEGDAQQSPAVTLE